MKCNLISKELIKIAKSLIAQDERLYFDLGFSASDKKAEEILRSIFGQLSDGMWENVARMKEYWACGGIESRDGRLVLSVYNEHSKGEYSPWKKRFVYTKNGWYNKSAEEVKKKLASLLKAIAKRELEDNFLPPTVWNRNSTERLEYLGYKEEITVRDAYRVYDKLLDRKTRVFI